jgi:meso-butanediol dehydrogenase / (S,S)-butanediol dehydrogenase / diacetyl reductase
MAGRLNGKVALITGTGGGMGRAAAELFAGEGARVAGCDVSPDGAAETVRRVTAEGGKMISLHPCDLTDPAAAQAIVDLTIDTFGGVDIVYNNAASACFNSVAAMTFAEWEATIAGELHLVFHVCSAVWPHLISRGGGSIISTASVAGHRGSAINGILAHSTGKGGLIAMSRQLAAEGGTHGIRSNTISPGIVVSPATESRLADPDWRESQLATVMLGRLGRPDDVAKAALFLASDDADWITGIDLRVDGGMVAWSPRARP